MDNTISHSELVIMKLLWEKSPLTASEINELIDRNWRKATVKTLINRLLNKQVIGFEKQGRAYYYHPNISKSDYLKAQNKSFLNELYDGNIANMMAAFTSHESLSDDEIQDIKSLISKLEEGS